MPSQSCFCRIALIFGLMNGLPQSLWAHHPNEGSVSLDQLYQEARAQNLELKEIASDHQAFTLEQKAATAKFYPKISLEGGPVSTRFDDERSSGTALYGKVEWNLYRGGIDSKNLEIAQLRTQSSEKRNAAAPSRILREVSRLFYELQFLEESLALKETALRLNQEQMKLATLKRKSGFTSSSDVLEFELREATLSSDLKMISQAIGERSRDLARLVGRKETDAPIEVAGHLPRQNVQPSLDQLRHKIHHQAVDRNSEVMAARLETELSQLDSALAVSESWPSLDFEAKVGKLANEEKLFSESNNYSMMLKLTVPLFSGFESQYRRQSTGAKAVAKDLAFQQKSQQIHDQIENKISQLVTISERLTIEEKNLSQSEAYYKLTFEEYRRGVKNSPDMVGASERLLEARIRNLEYRKDFLLTQLNLYELVESDPSQMKLME